MRKISAVVAVLGLATLANAELPGFATGGASATERVDVFNNAVADFMWDDGTGETSIGVNNMTTGTPFGWANRFTNTTGGPITLMNIEVAFGRTMGAVGALAVGNAADGVIWLDAAATGSLNNATVTRRWALPGGVHAIDGTTFATHAIPGGGVVVPNGAQFYVGLGDIQTEDDMMIRFPASEDQTDPDVPGVSWAFFGPAIFDPNPAANTSVGTIESFGAALAGNWLIRANVPEPATLGLLAVGGLALLRRRR